LWRTADRSGPWAASSHPLSFRYLSVNAEKAPFVTGFRKKFKNFFKACHAAPASASFKYNPHPAGGACKQR
ncbi:MAG: hypothetical protein IKI23_01435, partial [Lachnospiraceae bacterium]|nr:hypothetical protein [Lachnospiraceae bacterium]